MKKKSFSKHIDRVHTSNVSKRVKEKCNDCGKIMLKESLSMHMKSVHFKEKVKCDECGVELAVGSLKSHKGWYFKVQASANCGECGAKMLKGSLKRHLRTIHGIET